MIDFHLHSSASDGTDSPSKIIDIAINKKLKAIALTDHDTIDGIHEFLKYGEDKDIITISGIEISIKHEPERDIKDVHIVGLNIDFESNELIKTLKSQSKGRIDQKREICERLHEEFGYKISFDEVKEIAGGKTIGRPHIVEILIRNNPELSREKNRDEIFRMISLGGPAYVERKFELTLESAIDLIDSAGGIPILAHPGIYNVENKTKFIRMCVEAGIKGIEIEYTYNKNRPWENTDRAEWAQNYFPDFFRKLAEKFNLIKSGGSDYHGSKKNIMIGEANVPDEYLKKFLY
ncbi:MAG: PHP domain-containing protein [Promethearchaeota archaeon]